MQGRVFSWKASVAAGAALALLLVLVGLGLSPAIAGGHSYGGGGGGGGVGVGIGVGVGAILLNEAIRRHQQKQQVREAPRGCEPPAVYSKKAHGCVVPSKGKAKEPEKKPQVAKCEAPTIYSRKAHGCINPNKGNEPEHAKCEAHFVQSGQGCVCESGYIDRGGECVSPPVVVVDPGHDKSPPFEPLPPDAGLPSGPPPGGGAPPSNGGPPEPVTPVAQGEPAPTQCLPQDLYDLLVGANGQRPGLSVCPTSCLPKPLSYSDAELDTLAKKGGFEWCTNCLEVGAYMPLNAILQIEKRGNLTICVDPSLCRLPPVYVGRHTEIHTIYESLPSGVENEGNIAVIVGNHDYQGDVPDNPNANSDADAVKNLLIDQLGYAQENIIDLRDGTLSNFERVFGSESDPGGEIAKRIDKQDPADVFVYVASHGMVKEDDLKQVYLLPVDAHVDDLDKTAYGLQELYDNLGKTGARTTMLLLEANFAKNLDELINPPNLPGLEVEAMPANAIPGLVVLKASDRDQRAVQDPEYGIGLFTRYAIEGFAGKADQAPIGNDDKRIDTVELYVYTADMVRQAARKSFGLEQKPLLSKIDNLVVGQLAAN